MAWLVAVVAAGPVVARADDDERERVPFLPRAGKRWYLGIELGHTWTGDPRNLFGNGLGRALVVGFKGWELRGFEDYDLENRAAMSNGVTDGTNGRLTITSAGRRFSLARGPVVVRALAGAAWLRRSNVSLEPDDLRYELRSQHGLAALVGGGVAFGPLSAELRAYPAVWSDLAGHTRYVYDEDGGGVNAEVVEDSPGGMPITLTIGAGISW